MQIKKQGNFAITAKKLFWAIPKIPHIFLEGKMLRKIDAGSIFGNAQRTSYEYMKLLSKTKRKKIQKTLLDILEDIKDEYLWWYYQFK